MSPIQRVSCGWVGGVLAASLLSSGCASLSHTEKGMGVGTLAGGGLGAAIGSLSGNAGLGAAIGAGTGAIGGALVGNSLDKQEKRDLQTRLASAEAAAAPPPLAIEQVASLTQQGVSDPVIINQIRSSGSVYHLTAEQVAWLKQMNVSDAVVTEMQNTAVRQPVVVPPPRPAPVRTVVVHEPVYIMPPPPPPVGVGFFYRSR